MSRLFTPQTLGGHLKRLSLSRGMEAIIHESARAILADYAVHASRLSSLHVHVTISTRPYRLIVALRSGSSSGQKDSFFFFTFSLFLFYFPFFSLRIFPRRRRENYYKGLSTSFLLSLATLLLHPTIPVSSPLRQRRQRWPWSLSILSDRQQSKVAPLLASNLKLGL